MKKKRYRTLTGLTYPTDREIIKRLQAGEDIPLEERKLKTVRAGRIVTDIPAVSIDALLARGDIEPVEGD